MSDNPPAEQLPLVHAILQTLAYADVFDYPLTGDEIYRYLTGRRSQRGEIEPAIEHIPAIRCTQGLYTLAGRENLAELRRQRAIASRRLWPLAVSWGNVINRLPFVRMLAVTGSLAVDNLDGGADIDYLVVTEPGRLWLCRALVLLVRRFALRDGVTICPNYIITLNRLEFLDHSLYSAHEIAQMVPLAGMAVYAQVRARNSWMEGYLPNAQGLPEVQAHLSHHAVDSLERPGFEAVLRTPLFGVLERWEMQRKIKMLRQEQGESPESEFSADICKGHFHLHRTQTNLALEQRLSRLEVELYP